MSKKQNLYSGSVDDLENVELEKPLSGSFRHTFELFDNAYLMAAKSAQERGDIPSANVYAFLGILTNFAPKFDTPSEPYGPRAIFGNKRTYVPSDLSESDISVLKKLAPMTKNPSLRARLYDLIWVLRKDHNACAEAAKQYFDAGDCLNTNDNWVSAEACYKRGMQLATVLGRNKTLYKTLTDRLVLAVRKTFRSQNARSVRFMSLLLQFGCGDPNEFASLAERAAQNFEKKKDYYQAKMRWKRAAEFFKGAKNDTKEKECSIAYAESFVSEAKQKADGPNGNVFAAASLLQCGIEALRQAGGDKHRIAELRKQLAEYQENFSYEETFFSADLAEYAENNQKIVQGKSLEDALFIFALYHPLVRPEEEKQKVIEQIGKTPLAFLFSGSLIDEHGRSIANRPGLTFDSVEENQEALEQHTFASTQINWNCRTIGFINSVREQILNEHYPTFEDLLFIVEHSPFVPIGYEKTFLRGIHAGFHGDFQTACYFLVPQIENSLRNILEVAGVDTTNLLSDGTQPAKTLGALFNIPELEQILGADMLFELRGHLIEKSGYDFRNRLCHGFLADNDFMRVPAISVWWLVLRLCLTPIYLWKLRQMDGEAPEQV